MRQLRAGIVVATVAVSVIGILSVSVIGGAPRAAAADPAAGRYVFIDDARASSFSVNLDPDNPDFGMFTFGVQGVGLFLGAGPGTVEFKSDNSVIVRYDGAGFLDRSARLDFVFNLTMVSAATESTSIRLEAQVNPDRVTSSAQLWQAGAQYKLVDKQPPSSPGSALTSILSALQAQDWSRLYDLGYGPFRATISRADFTAQAAAAWTGRGTVTAVSVTGAPKLGDRRAGFDVAKATVAFTLTKDGTAATHLADVTLLEEPDGWKFISIDLRN